MKQNLKNRLTKKFLIVILSVTMFFNVIFPTFSFGDLGGILLKPISIYVMTNFDGINIAINLFLGGLDYSDVKSIEEFSTKIIATPENIFCGEYPILNANLFKADSEFENIQNAIFGYDFMKDIKQGAGTSTIVKLKRGVAGIYYFLRNVAAVVLLALLVYTGIRIVLSSSMPQEQAKWRGYLTDWLKALALLIFMHLIMISIFYVTDLLANSLKEALTNNGSIASNLRDKITDITKLNGVELVMATIMYGYLTYLTIVFAFAYFRRVIWTAILIVMAPVVALLYALGGQGKQIFNTWFREFLMNCLIQPYHIVIYYVLVILPTSIG